MKIRNYERKSLLLFLISLLFVIEVIICAIIVDHKECEYIKINSIVIKDNLVLVMVNKEEKKVLRNNKCLYYHDKKYVYKIVEDRGQVLKNGYYELVIKFNFSNNNIKANDILELVLIKEKINMIEFFKIIWEGD